MSNSSVASLAWDEFFFLHSPSPVLAWEFTCRTTGSFFVVALYLPASMRIGICESFILDGMIRLPSCAPAENLDGPFGMALSVVIAFERFLDIVVSDKYASI